MFLNILEKLMKEHGLNTMQFSQQSGIPYMTIKNFWKKGYSNVKLSTLKRIAEFFNVSLDYLIFGDDDTLIDETGEKNSVNKLSPKEQYLINAYRSHPEMQSAVDRLLMIENNTLDDISEEVKTTLKHINKINTCINTK